MGPCPIIAEYLGMVRDSWVGRSEFRPLARGRSDISYGRIVGGKGGKISAAGRENEQGPRRSCRSRSNMIIQLRRRKPPLRVRGAPASPWLGSGDKSREQTKCFVLDTGLAIVPAVSVLGWRAAVHGRKTPSG